MRALNVLMILALACAARAAQAQDCPAEAASLRLELRRAEGAMAQVDLDAFNDAMGHAEARLACLSGAIPPNDAVSLHVLMAAGTIGVDRQGALGSLRGALAIDPALRLSEAIAPPGSALHALLDEARRAGPGGSLEVLAAGDGIVWVDGRPSDTLPADRAAVVQVLAPDGRARWSGYRAAGPGLPPGAPLRSAAPTFDPFIPEGDPPPRAAAPAVTAPPLPAAQPPLPEPTANHTRPLLIGAGGAALGAVALGLAGVATHRAFTDPSADHDRQTLDRLFLLNHVTTAGAGALGLGSVGLALGAWAELRW